ncbi:MULTISPECIES: FadR/GntR family transcriptional regulator [Bacillus]|uniref:FadR/GntR family transcriptional regulator n=1 Tax=Bacillus TaxID=1386 RepID=UPI001D0D68FA|nr:MULTISPECIES: GntR family transcriptional regulator [Bacillus]
MTSTPKMYLEIVKEIRAIITEDGLTAGDKIPSERELSDRLKVGRSSVREALRALELLGLIETRRGEGTFMKDFTEHHLVDLLGTFILQSEKTKDDLIETKIEMEKLCLSLIHTRQNRNILLSDLIEFVKIEKELTHAIFFKKIAYAAGNHLIFRIWVIVSSYWDTFNHSNLIDSKTCLELLRALEQDSLSNAFKIYEKHFLQKMSIEE